MPDGRDGRVVLVVQDELVIRMDVVEAFETGGFKVFQADTAENAIDVLQREPTIRVVFTDVELPGTMDGLTLAEYVRHRWPPTILLVGSGRAVLQLAGKFLQLEATILAEQRRPKTPRKTTIGASRKGKVRLKSNRLSIRLALLDGSR